MSSERLAYSISVYRHPEEWAELWDRASTPRQVVGTFTTDKKGKAKISCVDVFNVNATPGPTNKPLPALLNPLINLRALAIYHDVTGRVAQVSIDKNS